MQVKAVQSVEGAAAGQRAAMAESAGLGKRDYVPLFIAIFVDFCLLLVSIGRPMNRFVSVKKSMLEAQQGPVYQILERFHDVHGDRDLKRQFELFKEGMGLARFCDTKLNEVQKSVEVVLKESGEEWKTEAFLTETDDDGSGDDDRD